MPIIVEVNKVLFENKSPRDAVNELMQRVGKDELEYDPWKKRETETGKQRQG